MRHASITFMLALLLGAASAQDYPRKDLNLEQLSDAIFPLQDMDLNYEELYENLAQLLANPLDVNTAGPEQLRALFVLKEEEINALLSYRQDHGPLLSVYELQAVPGWDRNTFDRIIPFVTVVSPETRLDLSLLQRLNRAQSNYLVVRYDRILEQKKGFSPDEDSTRRYMGSPERMYLRYRLAKANDFSFGITCEKDAGESLSWSPPERQYGCDFLSAHLQLQDKGRIKNLIVGDFQAQFGQGLTLGSVFGVGKNSETVTTTRRSSLGFIPYTSVNENQYFRGFALTAAVTRELYFHGFFSRTRKDAVAEDDSDENLLTSFLATGLHRTLAELQSRQQVAETNAAAVLQWKHRQLEAGALVHHANFDIPVRRKANAYNQFTFNGSDNETVSLYLNYSWANFTFFSEAAQNIGKGMAVTAGLLGSLSKKLEASVLTRNFDVDYHTFTANAFSENTTPQNERGLYWGLKYQFNRKYSASAYMDLFQFPWLRYRGYAPSDGMEWMIHLSYAPSKNAKLFLQVREESKVRNLADPGTIYKTANGVKRNYWINCDYGAPPFTFKSRAQFSTYSIDGRTSAGLALIQDVECSLRRWTFSFRCALFDTDDYDNRLYVYEKDVWLAYSFPAYYGVGVRKYGMVQFALSRSVALWFRWSQVRYSDRAETGSGTELIKGNTINDVKFQLRITF